MFSRAVQKTKLTNRRLALMKKWCSSNTIPSHARAVVIGGGVIGNSVAYHLASMGMKDVVLLEQNQVTSGTTWHAAGLMVTFGSLSETSTDMRKYTKELYSKTLEAETGHSTGFKPVGFIELATDSDRLEEYRRIAAFNRRHGVNVQEISPKEVLEKFPLCNVDDVRAGFYVADDGRVNPVDATVAFSKAARQKGVQICEGVGVSNILEKVVNSQRRVSGVVTSKGDTIHSEYVINCAGMWARQLGEQNGVVIPNQAAEHYYLITDAMKEVDPNWPVVEDPSSYTYIRPEAGGLMLGLFEAEAASWNAGGKGIPSDFSFGEIPPDFERMQPYIEKAMKRVPATMNAGIKMFFCGPESFTPDLAPCVGESPEIGNYFVAAGLNSIGILTGGGIGRALASWVVNGHPDVDVTGFNVDRLHAYQSNPRYRSERVVESLGNVYKCHYPFKTPQTARGAKHTPMYAKTAKEGAFFRAVSGFETADWYEQPDVGAASTVSSPTAVTMKDASAAAHQPNAHHSREVIAQHMNYGWGRPSFWANWEREHRACREGVVLIDMSFMSKFLVQGRDAGECLNRLCTADVDGPAGMLTYTQCLSERGTMEADITVNKLAGPGQAGQYMVIATDSAHRHMETLLRRGLDPDACKHVTVTDMTGAYSQLNIQGPQSRAFMQHLVDGTFPQFSSTEVDQETYNNGSSGCSVPAVADSMSNENFPFRAAREVAIGLARVIVARITYVGELGYELHIPTEFATHVHDCVLALKKHWDVAHPATPLVHCGLKALGSLRMEKAYRDFGHDMDNLDTLLEVGLGFTADMEKAGGFVGKNAVAAQKEQLKSSKGLKRRLCQVLVKDPEPMLYHGEVIRRNGVVCGDVRVGTYGHTLGGSVGLAMIDAVGSGDVVVNKTYLEDATWEIEIAGKLYPAVLSLQPLYDPKNLRIKA